MFTLPPGYKIQQPITSSVAGTSGSQLQLQLRPYLAQQPNGPFIVYQPPAQIGQQLTPPNNTNNNKPGQRKGAKDKESPVGQKFMNATTSTPMMLSKSKYERIWMACSFFGKISDF
jgi:hypothetical protein